MRNLNFTNKEEYLQYRKDWKLDYLKLNQIIKDKKISIKEFNRSYNKAKCILHDTPFQSFTGILRDLLDNNLQLIKVNKIHNNHPGWDSVLILKKEATEMLKELRQSKCHAQELYLKNKRTRIDNLFLV